MSYFDDEAFRPVGMTGEGLALVDLVQYNAAGAMTSFERRDAQGGVITHTFSYNSLYQMTNQTVTLGGTTLQNLSYAYPATQNNGQIASQTNALSGETVEYQYDQLSRLISAATPGAGGWGLTFTYDGFGNKTNQTVSKGSAPAHSLSINQANNRIAMTGYGYDANGNMTTMPLLTASYDVANRMVETQHSSAGTHRYHYNHANQRVMRYTDLPWAHGGYSYQRRFSLYGLGGELLLEADLEPNCVSGCPTPADKETLRNVYFAGRKLFVSVNQWPLQAVLPNRLGSPGDHYPFGEQKGAAPDGGRNYFTTYWRDQTGLDYAWNRYYAPSVGRFTTADPYGGSARPEDPQSWNRYGYADNEPIGRTDPTGLYWWDPWSLMQGPSFPDWTGGWGGWNGGPAVISDGWGLPWFVPWSVPPIHGDIPSDATGTPPPSGVSRGAVMGGRTGFSQNIAATAPVVITIGGLSSPPIVITVTVIAAGAGAYLAWRWIAERRSQNVVQNRQFLDAVRRYERECGRPLSPDDVRRLHDWITGQGFDLHQIVEEAKGLFGCPAQDGTDDRSPRRPIRGRRGITIP